MLRAIQTLALAALTSAVQGFELLKNEPIVLYNDVSPKLRIVAKDSAFNGALPKDFELVFVPKIDPSVYTLNVASDKLISLVLHPGKKWQETVPGVEGTTIYLLEIKIKGENKLTDGAVPVAKVIPTPSVLENSQIIYTKGSRQFVINGTFFNPKRTDLIFEPPLIRNQDYILNVASKQTLVLTRTTNAQWRSDPGPLKLRRIDTGGGQLRVNADKGGILVAEVQADLDVHGVTVEATPNERSYQSTGRISIIGSGFNADDNHLRFANGLRGHGVNYTTVDHSKDLLTLALTPGSKWRANAENLPGPLNLLAVDAGGGFVAVGPTEAKKGRAVATIFEDVSIEPQNSKVVFASHTHEVWIVGKGFTRGEYKTQLTFDPPLEDRIPSDVTMLVYNRTHIKLTLFEGESWLDKKVTQPISLRVMSVNTGPGPVGMNVDGSAFNSALRQGGSAKGVVIAVLKPDEEQHADVQVARSTSQSLYQTAVQKDLKLTGKGFVAGMELVFDNGLTAGVDYTLTVTDGEHATLALKENRKWRVEGGALKVVAVKIPKSETPIPVGSGGEGVAVAEILDDPFITAGERIIFATHTKQLAINGYGFVLDDTRVTLTPTLADAYYLDTVEPYRITLRLRDGFSWADNVFTTGATQDIFVTKIDTRAGEVLMNNGDGVVVAKVEADLDDNNCDDSCEYAFDGLCDDGTSKERQFADDDYGGLYSYSEGQYYDYGYYYYKAYDDEYYDDDDTFLAAICDVGTDCTDCGGPKHATDQKKVECDNSCQWANDGFCDDDRTSGLCSAGTDCHDCGPVGASNFTSLFGDDWEWNADGDKEEGEEASKEGAANGEDEEGDSFWDDDDNYWAGDDELAYAPIEPEADKSRTNDGAGSLFINAMQSIVYFLGIIFCTAGAFVAFKVYKTGAPPMVFPEAEEEDESSSRLLTKKGSANVPITPDVFHS